MIAPTIMGIQVRSLVSPNQHQQATFTRFYHAAFRLVPQLVSTLVLLSNMYTVCAIKSMLTIQLIDLSYDRDREDEISTVVSSSKTFAPTGLGQLRLSSLWSRYIEYQFRLGVWRKRHLCRVAGKTV